MSIARAKAKRSAKASLSFLTLLGVYGNFDITSFWELHSTSFGTISGVLVRRAVVPALLSVLSVHAH